MNIITFPNKTNMNTDPTIPETSKVTDDNINEIKNAINNLIYPIGAIIANDNENFDPNILYGGTWEKIKGKMIIGYDESDDDFNTLTATGGSKTHTQTVEELAKHRHQQTLGGDITNTSQEAGPVVVSFENTSQTGYAGEGKPMDIMNPYYVANLWHRIA